MATFREGGKVGRDSLKSLTDVIIKMYSMNHLTYINLFSQCFEYQTQAHSHLNNVTPFKCNIKSYKQVQGLHEWLVSLPCYFSSISYNYIFGSKCIQHKCFKRSAQSLQKAMERISNYMIKACQEQNGLQNGKLTPTSMLGFPNWFAFLTFVLVIIYM